MGSNWPWRLTRLQKLHYSLLSIEPAWSLRFSSKYQRVARLRLVRFHLKDILIFLNKLSCARHANKGSSYSLYPVTLSKPISISLSDCAPQPEAETESGIRLVDSSHDKYYRFQRLAFYLSSLFQSCPIRLNLEFLRIARNRQLMIFFESSTAYCQ